MIYQGTQAKEEKKMVCCAGVTTSWYDTPIGLGRCKLIS